MSNRAYEGKLSAEKGNRMNRLIKDQTDLSSWVRDQAGNVNLAVAFWGEGALKALGLAAGQNFRVLLDLNAGGTNPQVVEELLRLSPEQVRQIERLHAKVYVGCSEVVIGSANASTSGLGVEGFESRHWTELSLYTDDVSTVAAAKNWFEAQWSESERISTSDLDAARVRWKRMRKALPPRGSARSILNVARQSPHELHGRDIYVCVTTGALSSAGEKELARAEKVAGVALYAYEDWPDIPINVTMIAFEAVGGPAIRWDEPRVQRTPDKKKKSKLKYVTPTELEGFSIGNANEWRKRIRYYRDHPAHSQTWRRDRGVCKEVHEFVALTNAAMVD
jgi:hypothetical protein